MSPATTSEHTDDDGRMHHPLWLESHDCSLAWTTGLQSSLHSMPELDCLGTEDSKSGVETD